jgi:hypothetical protein
MMQRKLAIYILVLVIALSFADISGAAPYFRGTGLMNIPTAYIPQQGFFDIGIHTAIRDQKRDELAIRIDFGIFNLAELGLIGLKRQDTDYVMGNAKLLLSRESGSAPGLSVGVDNFGEKVQDDSEDYRRSVYGVLSKQFNLPVVHLISGHLGIGSHRYKADTSIGKYLHGVFIALNKELHLSFLDSQLQLMFEADGKDLNAGLRYKMSSGLSVSMAAGELSSDPGDVKYYIGVSFTNSSMMKKIDQSSELAKRAVRIANEKRFDNNE